MNNRFKFRVRDLARNCWLNTSENSLHCFTDYLLSFDGRVTAVEGAISDHEQISYARLDWTDYGTIYPKLTKAEDRFVVQQWTGFKDTSEIDIFEGDIIEYKSINNDIEYFTIVFNNGHFCLKNKDNHLIPASNATMHWPKLTNTQFRVVRSLFETP